MRHLLAAAALLAGTPALAANVLYNPGFELTGGGPTVITGGAATTGPSAAPGWTSFNNTLGTTTTSLVLSTDPLTSGGLQMLSIDVTGPYGSGAHDGIYQFSGLFNYATVDIFVTSGVFEMIITNDYGAHNDTVLSTATGQWQRMSASFTNANAIALYAHNGPASFFVDNVYAGDVPNPAPLGTVPEPASWALLVAGFGLTGAALRRRASTLTEVSC